MSRIVSTWARRSSFTAAFRCTAAAQRTVRGTESTESDELVRRYGRTLRTAQRGVGRVRPLVVRHIDHPDIGDGEVSNRRRFDLGMLDVLATADDRIIAPIAVSAAQNAGHTLSHNDLPLGHPAQDEWRDNRRTNGDYISYIWAMRLPRRTL